jgi:hypothetical protein
MVTSCPFGGANGPCKTEIEKATGSTLPTDIAVRRSDAMYPVGRADTLQRCTKMKCQTECWAAQPAMP